MATGVAILRIFYDILHVLISFETLFKVFEDINDSK